MWEDDKVFGISDMHVDMAVNFAWLHNLPTRPRDILIVAGDLCTGLTTLRKALALLVAKFRLLNNIILQGKIAIFQYYATFLK